MCHLVVCPFFFVVVVVFSYEEKKSRGYLFTIISCCFCLIRVYLAARVSPEHSAYLNL